MHLGLANKTLSALGEERGQQRARFRRLKMQNGIRMRVFHLTDEELEARLLELGLTFERIQLKTKPNAIHWHIRKPGDKGTLEATFESGMVSLHIRANRAAGWMDAILVALA